jgi:hypothetical protein
MEIAKLFTKKILIIFIVALNITFIAFYNSVTDKYLNLELFGLMTDENTEEYNIDDIKFDYEINQDSLVENQNLTYCENSQEWSDINGELFIRRKTAKYFIDRKSLLVFTMSRTGWVQNFKFIFDVSVFYKNNLISYKKYNHVKTEQFISINGYEDYSMSVNLDLEDYISSFSRNENISKAKIEADDVRINFFISIFNKHKKLKMNSKIINATVGYYRNRSFKTKSAIICTEPLFLENKDYQDFEFWIELNKLIGYEKIAIFNNSIPNNDLFNSLFERNKNFIDVIQFNCLPNFIKKGDKYLRKYKEFIVGEWGMGTIMFLGFDTMANNECFYHYSDRAKLILVQDNDEAFIPPKLIRNFESSQKVVGFLSKTSYFTDKNSMKTFQESFLSKKFCESKPNYLSSYIQKIYVRNKLGEDHSIYFPQVVFGKPDLIELIFDQIDKYLEEKTSKMLNYPIKIIIKQDYNDSEPNYQDQQYATDFTILIRDYDEYKYAINMNYIYKNYIKQFMNKANQNVAQVSQLFSRFYYFNEPLKHGSYGGKSMGNPNKATFVSPHFSNGITFSSRENYLSHFRNRHILNRGEVPITTINIDFNYLICYFIPIYEKFMK